MQAEESEEGVNKRRREFLLKSAEHRRDYYTMEWRTFSKKSAEGRKDEDGGFSLSTPLTMDQKDFSKLTD